MEIEKRLLSINELIAYTGLGRSKALAFGVESGALMKFGRRNLYDRVTVDEYIAKKVGESHGE